MKNTILSIAKKIIDGILAGLLISLGGTVFLACSSSGLTYGKYIGAFLFPLALICICMRGYALYTGKIGLLPEKHSKEDVSVLLLCLLGNTIATVAVGYLIALTFPSYLAYAKEICTAKLDQGLGFALVRAFFCGILVYLAVDVWKSHRSALGIILCITAFILSGYEHSIADIFYFATSGIVSWDAFLYLVIIILGNSLGGLLIPVLQLIRPSEKKTSPSGPDEKV